MIIEAMETVEEEIKDASQFTETTDMKDISEFTLAEEIKDTSEFKETTEMKDVSDFTLAETKETTEMKDISEFTLAEPKEIPEMKDFFEFTLAEALEMERLYKKHGEDSQQQEICEELATKFNRSAIRDGKCIITADQVHTWFVDRHAYSAIKSKRSLAVAVSDAARKPLQTINPSPNALTNLVALSKAWADAKIPTKPKAQRVAELPDLMFEALSSKDCAWYDVAVFLNFRVMYTGELAIRVRFSGFSHDEDEWVNARNGIRERSIPLVASECHKVKVGDLCLCYRANEDHALYSDAHVVRIERQSHDNDNCTCTFVVRFEYDNAEGELQCSEICIRPS